MSAPPLAIRPAAADDLPYVERLLARAGLPHEDVRSSPVEFRVGTADGDRVAVGGVEPAGDAGLLRSVAVDDAVRGRGYGTAMCDELEAAAARDGVDALYLLTTTAAAFFADRGYGAVPRSDAPAAVRGTREFAEVCPDSATCMRKRL
ncbi:MAG: arsenic resistance N-acetyltransferase ArsN2 [Haloferacaceae archaeon]